MSGADAPRPRLREVSELMGAVSSRAETQLGASANPAVWTDLTNTMEGLISAAPSASLAASRSRSLLAADLAAEGDPAGRPSQQDQLPAAAGGRMAAESGEALVEAGAREASDGVDFLGVGDMSLKFRLKFVCNRTLEWVRAIPQAVFYAAVQAAWRGDFKFQQDELPSWAMTGGEGEGVTRGGRRVGDGKVEVREKDMFLFARGLLHFRHPGVPLLNVVSSQWQTLFSAKSAAAGSVESGREKGGEVHVEAVRRLESWQKAFRSLFYGFRFGQVPGFDVLLSTTVVRFVCSAGAKSGEDSIDNAHGQGASMWAVIAQATPGLVAQLQRGCIPFTSVATGPGEKEPDARGRQGLDGMDDFAPDEKSREGRAKNFEKLIVRGAVDVHALFNFILEAGPRLGNAVDVPLLVADVPFVGAELTSCQLRLTRETRTASGSLRQDLWLDGLMTQLQFSRLVEALHIAQGGEYTMLVDTEERSQRVNERPFVVSRVVCSNDEQDPSVYTREVK